MIREDMMIMHKTNCPGMVGICPWCQKEAVTQAHINSCSRFSLQCEKCHFFFHSLQSLRTHHCSLALQAPMQEAFPLLGDAAARPIDLSGVPSSPIAENAPSPELPSPPMAPRRRRRRRNISLSPRRNIGSSPVTPPSPPNGENAPSPELQSPPRVPRRNRLNL